MAGDDDGLQNFITRICTAGRRGNTIKRVSFKFDDRSLADGTYQSGHDRPPHQPPPHRLPPINHHHIIHHQGILYNILNLVNFSTRRNYKVSSINIMMLKMIIKIKGWSMEGVGDSLILTLRGKFSNPNRRSSFPNSIHDKRGGYSNLDEFWVPSFDGNLNIESSLL